MLTPSFTYVSVVARGSQRGLRVEVLQNVLRKIEHLRIGSHGLAPLRRLPRTVNNDASSSGVKPPAAATGGPPERLSGAPPGDVLTVEILGPQVAREEML